ncbi:hypothetical protein D0863_04894 [Hortaea werneckii]|uniref:N-acetyltransferase domain-containing protein n=1 Tax=Hortaea werneckii TaxID=91943 RepID=A0A3M7E6N3_HORWE|nr:hypothetical protein D0863_04894 [Hortaea werneckii]
MTTSDSFVISPAETQEDFNAVLQLFEAYALALGIDLSFQDFAAEVASLPGKYALPTGCLLLARDQEGQGRGSGLGKMLAERVIVEARRMGYQKMRLDTLPSMQSARALYKAGGFEEIEPYYRTPIQGTIFMELQL